MQENLQCISLFFYTFQLLYYGLKSLGTKVDTGMVVTTSISTTFSPDMYLGEVWGRGVKGQLSPPKKGVRKKGLWGFGISLASYRIWWIWKNKTPRHGDAFIKYFFRAMRNRPNFSKFWTWKKYRWGAPCMPPPPPSEFSTDYVHLLCPFNCCVSFFFLNEQ